MQIIPRREKDAMQDMLDEHRSLRKSRLRFFFSGKLHAYSSCNKYLHAHDLHIQPSLGSMCNHVMSMYE